jgi:hypothetical protein
MKRPHTVSATMVASPVSPTTLMSIHCGTIPSRHNTLIASVADKSAKARPESSGKSLKSRDAVPSYD